MSLNQRRQRSSAKPRIAERAKVVLPATIETVSARTRVDLINVSATGALVAGDRLPAQGKDVLLKAGPVDMLGVVAWTEQGLCGIAFDNPVPDAHVRHLQGEGQATAEAGLAPEQKQAIDDWRNGLHR